MNKRIEAPRAISFGCSNLHVKTIFRGVDTNAKRHLTRLPSNCFFLLGEAKLSVVIRPVVPFNFNRPM